MLIVVCIKIMYCK